MQDKLGSFSAAVESLYAAAGDPARWDDALRSIELLTGSAGAVFDLVPRSDTVAPRTIAGSFGPSECSTYARDYMPICRRIAFALQEPGGTHYDYLHITEAEMDRDPVYEWFASYGLRYYIGSWVGESPNYRITFSLQRSRGQGHASDQDVALFDQLKVHVARALTLADQLGSLHSLERLGSAVIDGLPQAVFGLSADGRVVHCNSAAWRLLDNGDGLAIAGGRLRLICAAETAELDRLIAEASSMLPLARTGWARVSRPSGAPPYALFVAPLRIDDDQLLATRAKILVVVHDPWARRSADPQMLTAVYDLTDTEARLASAISGGHSLESAAETLNMRTATARTHLKSIFAKLGVNRQQDLVRLLTSLSTIKAS